MMQEIYSGPPLQKSHTAGRIFHIYRLGLSGILLAGYLLTGDDFLSQMNAPFWFLASVTIWFWVAAATSLCSRLLGESIWLTSASFVVDMVALSILGWASGGLSGGILFLMLPTAALAGLTLPTRLALLVASVATIGTFSVQTVLILDFQLPPSVYFPSGLLGITLFLCTFTFKSLERRISASEATAERNRQIAESFQQLSRTIIEDMKIGVLVIDTKNQIQMANQAAHQMILAGRDQSWSLVGNVLEDFPKLYKSFRTWRDNPKQPVTAFTQSYSGVNLQPDFDAVSIGEQTQTLIWLEDTRTTRQRAQELKLNSLGQLSAGLAHEIRNPLSAIQQANDLLSHSPVLTEGDQGLSAIIDRHCNRMNEIIDVVQQLARQIAAKIEPIDLTTWLNEYVREYREVSAESVEIVQEIAPNSQFYFDSRHMKQVLGNLFDNAIRHSRIAGNNPYVKITSERDKGGKLLFIDIHDKGLGIASRDQQRVFDPFFTTEPTGSGLGLYLARELCEANFASINYQSQQSNQSPDDSYGYFRISCWLEPPEGYDE